MRILHLLASPVWSGPAENVALLAVAQRELGHEVTVAIDRLRTATTSEEPAAQRLRELGVLDESGFELSVKSSLPAMWRDLRRLRNLPIDVIHSHFSHDHVVARFGRAADVKLVRSIHAPRSIRWSLPDADAYTVPAASLVDRLRSRGRVVEVLPALVAPSFVPSTDRGRVRKTLGIQGDPIIGMVSTFQPGRRHDVAVAAFAQLRDAQPNARLVLVGDGVLVPAVRSQVASLGLGEHVTFAGYQSGNAFAQWLQALDEVWILGLGNDWSGRAAAQARACGVRVVAVDEGGLAAHADAIVQADVQAVLAGRSALRTSAPPTSNRDIAKGLLALYERLSR